MDHLDVIRERPTHLDGLDHGARQVVHRDDHALPLVRLVEHQPIADRPLLLLGVPLVFTGVQLLTFGLLAEVMARTYYESQGKPTYVIREVRESDPPAEPPALAAVR